MNGYIIVPIESYEGEDTHRHQSHECLYAVVQIQDGVSAIIDDGYRSYDEAYTAWSDKVAKV